MKLVVALVVSVFVTAFAPLANGQPVRIESTSSVATTRSIRGGELHEYELVLQPDIFARLTIQQVGIDIIATVVAPDGQRVATVDRPNTAFGREAVSFIGRTAGAYRVQIRSLTKSAPPGTYQLTLTDLRPTIARDENRLGAEKAITEGEEFRAQNTAAACRQAIERFNEALTLWRGLDDPDEQIWALYGLGLSHRFLGEQQTAIAFLDEGLTIARARGDRHGQAMIQTALGWAYLYAGETERAGAQFLEALPLRRMLNDVGGEALTESGIGWSAALLSKRATALDHFRAALSLRRTLGDRRGEALISIGVGKVLVAEGQHAEALAELTAAASTLREQDAFGYAEALSQLGWAYIALGDSDAALTHLTESLSLRREVGDRTGEATTLFGIARAERVRGRLKEALQAIEPALDLLEGMRREGDSQQLRMAYFASVQDYYAFAIDLLMLLHRQDTPARYDLRAYEIHQRARARGLLDLLQEASVDIRSSVRPELLGEERRARQDVNAALERQDLPSSRRATGDARRQATRELLDAIARHDAIEQRIRGGSPQYRALSEPKPLGVRNIQQDLLDRDTLVLDYAVGPERSFVWAITRQSVKTYELPSRSKLETVTRRFRDGVTARATQRGGESGAAGHARIGQADARFASAARALSDMVLPPALMPGPAVRRIVVVPHGVLQLVPFGALPVRTRVGPSKRVPLIAAFEVVHLPSTSALMWLRKADAREQPSRGVAIFADPIFDSSDERVTSRTPRSTPSNDVALPRLFASRWEAEQIASMVPKGKTRLLLDSAASRSAALDPTLGHYRALHFATHAFVDDRRPGLGGIQLSTFDARGRSIPGFLSLQDVYTLRLGNDLVVLGGCRTGLGTIVEGEGLVTLARGFFHAGVPRVVAGLWSVDDTATAQLMVHFYRAMLGPSHLSPAAALRHAQLEMRKHPRWKSPYYWAGFVLHGEWRQAR